MAVSGQHYVFAALTPGKELRYPLNLRLGSLQSRSGCFGEKKKSLVPAGVRIPDHKVRSVVTILIELFQYQSCNSKTLLIAKKYNNKKLLHQQHHHEVK